jgi:hypothetical protein
MTARLYKFPAFDAGDFGEDDPLGDGSDFGVTGEWWGSDTRPNLIDELAAENAQRDALAHYRKQVRKAVLQRYVRAFCLAVAVLAVAWFGLRELIGIVS